MDERTSTCLNEIRITQGSHAYDALRLILAYWKMVEEKRGCIVVEIWEERKNAHDNGNAA